MGGEETEWVRERWSEDGSAGGITWGGMRSPDVAFVPDLAFRPRAAWP